MLVDSHCHIDFEEYADRMPQLLENMARNQVTHALCVCVNLTDFPRVLALAEGHSQLFASVGVHPDRTDDAGPDINDLIERAKHPKIVAIGETGLDYYFKNAHAIKEVAKAVPLERMLVETDSPYLAPVPQRGKTNEPAWVRHVAEEIARLRGISLELVANATTGNFFRLFKPN